MSQQHEQDNDIHQGNEVALFDQKPSNESVPHIVNYVTEFARLLRRFRSNLPTSERAAEHFGQRVLGNYFGESVSRSTISRLESGNVGVAWGNIAAYLDKMGLWPEILNVMIKGHQPSRHHMLLVHNELKRKITEQNRIAHEKLSDRAKQERQYGTLR